MARSVVGKLTLIIYIDGNDEEGWVLNTNTGLITDPYPNKWLAMQDYLHGSMTWKKEERGDV